MAKQNEDRQINEFNLTIGGQIEQISVQTLSTTLLKLEEILKEVNSELGTNKELELTVKTYKPGSFDIYLQLLADASALGAASGLFNTANLETAKTVIETFSAILGVKKFLGGHKPKSIKIIEGNNVENSVVEVTNNSGNVTIINNPTYQIFINSEKIDQDIEKIFENLNKTPYVNALTIKDNNSKALFEADKAKHDFSVLLKPNPTFSYPDEEKRDVEKKGAIVSVLKVVFKAKQTWKVIYEGMPIEVKITAKEFLDDVMEHKYQFGSGDRLKCDLTIHQKYDELSKTYQNKGYTITRVIQVLAPEVQTALKTSTKRKK